MNKVSLKINEIEFNTLKIIGLKHCKGRLLKRAGRILDVNNIYKFEDFLHYNHIKYLDDNNIYKNIESILRKLHCSYFHI